MRKHPVSMSGAEATSLSGDKYGRDAGAGAML